MCESGLYILPSQSKKGTKDIHQSIFMPHIFLPLLRKLKRRKDTRRVAPSLDRSIHATCFF